MRRSCSFDTPPHNRTSLLRRKMGHGHLVCIIGTAAYEFIKKSAASSDERRDEIIEQLFGMEFSWQAVWVG